MNDISTEIKVMLARRNKTITWLAEQLGVTQPAISKKLRINDFRINEVKKIANLLEFDMVIDFKDISNI
ncbi:MAG: hypothetical protein E7K67_11215 [Peptostreptococcaceae bacterium]|nr:hypothetical protein [Clostridiales bacterium]MDU7537551.1 hypothetical protein [Peptostreptococcaceae bacterium]